MTKVRAKDIEPTTVIEHEGSPVFVVDVVLERSTCTFRAIYWDGTEVTFTHPALAELIVLRGPMEVVE